jgi:hypothetical protein
LTFGGCNPINIEFQPGVLPFDDPLHGVDVISKLLSRERESDPLQLERVALLKQIKMPLGQ